MQSCDLSNCKFRNAAIPIDSLIEKQKTRTQHELRQLSDGTEAGSDQEINSSSNSACIQTPPAKQKTSHGHIFCNSHKKILNISCINSLRCFELIKLFIFKSDVAKSQTGQHNVNRRNAEPTPGKVTIAQVQNRNTLYLMRAFQIQNLILFFIPDKSVYNQSSNTNKYIVEKRAIAEL